MPAAVANVEETVKVDLKSCPGGYVTLRRMTYGQIVQRRALTKLNLLMQGSRSNSKSVTGEMAMASKEVALFEFAHCIVDHNLEDNDGRVLQLSQESDFNRLDPRVGQEIEQHIGDMNNFEEDEVQGN